MRVLYPVLLGVWLGLVHGAAFGGAPLYRNDFSVRTSSAPIPATNVWHEATPYRTNNGGLCFRPTKSEGFTTYAQLSTRATYYAQSVNSEIGRPSVDGWFMPFFNYHNAYTLYKKSPYTKETDYKQVYITTDDAYKLTPTQYFDNGNPCFSFMFGSATRRAGVALNALHNSFTNGQLRIQVDMRAPDWWAGGYSYVRIFPVFDKYMDILAWNGRWCDRDEHTLDRCSITNSPVTPGKFGIRSTAGRLGTNATDKASSTYTNNCMRAYPQYYDRRNVNGGTTQLGNNYGTEFNYWHRFIVTYDLDTAHFGGEVYRIKNSVGHPTFDTELVSANLVARSDNPKRFSNALWQNCETNAAGELTVPLAELWREKGGISGIGIDGIGSFASLNYTSATNKVLVDNIRISWKAPDSADFEVFYENDFQTRRYRTLCPARRTTEASYGAPRIAATAAPHTMTYEVTSNLELYRLVPLMVEPKDKAQPVGFDGWRILPYADVNDANSCHPGILDYGGNAYDVGGEGGNVLTFGHQGAWGLMGQTLGAAYTTGKVRLVADVRLPLGGLNTWKVNTRRAAIGLGSAALYTADRNQLATNLAAGVGYQRAVTTEGGVNITNDVPYCLGASISAEKPGFVFEENPTIPEKATWYRYDITADLDAKTYDATITPIGTASVLPDFTLTNDAIYTVTAQPFAADVSDIGSFYLRYFGYGNATTASYINRRVCFDNIRVYRIVPAEEAGDEDIATLVYENTFDQCTRSTGESRDRAAGYLAEQYDRDDGPDHWIRRNDTGAAAFEATATVRDDGGNQYLALGREEEGGTRVQVSNTFGQYLKRAFRFRVDVRPPDAWGVRNGFVMFGLGSPQMEQTEIPVSAFDAARQAAFGFSNTVSTTQCPFYNPVSAAFALGGEGSALVGTAEQIDPSRWYRMVATVRPETGTYSVRVFDMGLTHPECDGAGGVFVAERKDIPFLNEMGAEGIGAFYIHSYGARGTPEITGVDAGNVMVDNIVVDAIPGAILSIR